MSPSPGPCPYFFETLDGPLPRGDAPDAVKLDPTQHSHCLGQVSLQPFWSGGRQMPRPEGHPQPLADVLLPSNQNKAHKSLLPRGPRPLQMHQHQREGLALTWAQESLALGVGWLVPTGSQVSTKPFWKTTPRRTRVCKEDKRFQLCKVGRTSSHSYLRGSHPGIES